MINKVIKAFHFHLLWSWVLFLVWVCFHLDVPKLAASRPINLSLFSPSKFGHFSKCRWKLVRFVRNIVSEIEKSHSSWFGHISYNIGYEPVNALFTCCIDKAWGTQKRLSDFWLLDNVIKMKRLLRFIILFVIGYLSLWNISIVRICYYECMKWIK